MRVTSLYEISKTMKSISLISLILFFFASFSIAQNVNQTESNKAFKAPNGKIYPEHWGQPPLRQTRDRRVLPGGYGQGSGTLARWIQENLDADAKDPRRSKKKKIPRLLRLRN